MTIELVSLDKPKISCFDCRACCCRLEVILISETGVPEKFIETAAWGGEVMARLDDGLCAALDRDTSLCTIYDNRPWVCREFELGSYQCLTERSENAADFSHSQTQQ